MGRNKLLLLLLIGVLPLYLLFLPAVTGPYVGNSPDENSYLFFSKLLSETSSLGYAEPLNETYDPAIFLPRSSVYSQETKLVGPGGFLGISAINAVVWSVTGENYFLNGLIAIIGLIFFYYLVKEIFDRKTALISFACMSVLPVYWFWSTRMYTDVPSLAFLFGSMLYLIRFRKNRELKYVAVSAILFSIAFWYRYFAVTFMALFLLIYFAFPLNSIFSKKNILALGMFGFISLVLIIPLLVFNNALYGHPLTTGQMLHPEHHFVEDMLGQLSTNFVKYFFSPALAFSLYSVLGVFGLILSWRYRYFDRRFSLFFIISFIFIQLYFAGGVYWGVESESAELSDSLMRYYMPLYPLLIPYGIFFVLRLRLAAMVKSIIIVALVIVSVITTPLAPANPLEFRSTRNSRTDSKNVLLEAIPADAIVFTRLYDKWIFPERRTAIYTYIRGPSSENTHMTGDLIKQLLQDDYMVYFLKEDLAREKMEILGYFYFDDYQAEFNRMGIVAYEVTPVVYRLALEGLETARKWRD
ncbi:MAG: glycosyltransferase family 39 protein [Dehalococcoidales bacterium]|nr:glycosyltransferase family 39 protein [Dehalococcoidales bacterium]